MDYHADGTNICEADIGEDGLLTKEACEKQTRLKSWLLDSSEKGRELLFRKCASDIPMECSMSSPSRNKLLDELWTLRSQSG